MIKVLISLISWLFNTAGINILLPVERQEFKGTIRVQENTYTLSYIVNSLFGNNFLDSEEIVIQDILIDVVLDTLHLKEKDLDDSEVLEYTWTSIGWKVDYLTSPGIITNLKKIG